MIDSFAPINPALLDVILPPSGYPDDKAAGDTPDVLKQVCGNATRSFPQELWIEPRDWADKGRENDNNKTWPINFMDRYTHQDPTHECTCHSLTRLGESATNRHRGLIFPDGPKKNFRYPESAEFGTVWLSPLSIYAEANPRERGGAGIRQVMEIACRRGFLPETMQPKDHGFKHAIQGTAGRGNNNQSSGPWLPLSRFPSGWQETAKHFRISEVIFPESFEQAVCLILHGIGVGVGRNGHAVPWSFLVFEGNDVKAAGYADSYDITRYDSARTMQSAASGSFGVGTMTTPDNWLKPAG